MGYTVRDIFEYIIALVNEFAKRFGLSDKQAFNYIHNHKGVLFIEKNYGIIHTLDFAEAVDSVATYCRRTGHQIPYSNMSESDVKYMVEALAADLAELLAKDFGMNVAEALDALYNSTTYEKLLDPRTGLYFQSSLYVYSFLKNEVKTGKIA